MGRARPKQARDVLEKQACQCLDAQGRPVAEDAPARMVKVLCLRCELLELLGAPPRV